jgi:endonuclease III
MECATGITSTTRFRIGLEASRRCLRTRTLPQNRRRARRNSVRWSLLLGKLEKFYSKGVWRVPVLRERDANPFLVLVSTILSHRTRDEVTERATRRLLDHFPTPMTMAASNPNAIQILVSEVGFSEAKSRAIWEASRTIVSKHHGRVPTSHAELIALPLVGPKTANAVLVFGHHRPAIPVDAHILRVANRLGVVQTSTISETIDALASVVPQVFWAELNPVLVQHGQNICRVKAPLCDRCPIRRSCWRVGVS